MAKTTTKTGKNPETKVKETTPQVQESPPKADIETPPEAPETPPEASDELLDVAPDATPKPLPEAKETETRYIFPRQADIKCPGCGLYETVATSSPQGPIQWRRCTRAIPVCRRTFKITGTEVKITDCKQGT